MCTFTFLDETDNRQWTQQRLADNKSAIVFAVLYMKNRPTNPMRRCSLYTGYEANPHFLIGTATMSQDVPGDIVWTPKGMEHFTGLER